MSIKHLRWLIVILMFYLMYCILTVTAQAEQPRNIPLLDTLNSIRFGEPLSELMKRYGKELKLKNRCDGYTFVTTDGTTILVENDHVWAIYSLVSDEKAKTILKFITDRYGKPDRTDNTTSWLTFPPKSRPLAIRVVR